MRDDLNSHVRYPAGSPASWLRNEEIVGCTIYCVATGCRQPNVWHAKNFRLEELPDQPWWRLGKRFVCARCGTRGAVNIAPRWHSDVGRPSHG